MPLTSSEKHKILRHKQSQNLDSHHHPKEKLMQLESLSSMINGNILELFSGQGNLTGFYKSCGNVTECRKETTGDSVAYAYSLVANKKKFDVIDVDGYGYPSSFMDVVFKMMKPDCLLIITFPVIGVQCVNGIQEQHFVTHWRSSRPTVGDIVGATTDCGLKHWYLSKLIDVQKIKPVWRLVFKCTRVKATEFTHTKNRKEHHEKDQCKLF